MQSSVKISSVGEQSREFMGNERLDDEFVSPDTDDAVSLELETSENLDGEGANQVVTYINLQLCSVCGSFYEQLCNKLIPNPDINSLIYKLLEIELEKTEEENEKVSSKYISICEFCSKKVKLFEQLRQQYEDLKSELVSSIVSTLSNNEKTSLRDIKQQILKRWSASQFVDSEDVIINPNKSETKASQRKCTIVDWQHTAKPRVINAYIVDRAETSENSVSNNVIVFSNANDDEYPSNWTIAEEITVSEPDARIHESSGVHNSETLEHSEYIVREVCEDELDYQNISSSISSSNRKRKAKDQNAAFVSKKSKDTNDSLISNQEEKPSLAECQLSVKKMNEAKRLKPPYFCDDCGRVYSKWVAYKIHRKNCNGDSNGRLKKCSLCTADFTSGSWQDLKLHFDEKHPNYRLERCNSCRTDFLPSTLKFHSCGFKAVDYGKLKANFQCDLCDKIYFTRSNLTDHVRRYHKEEKKLPCNSCNKTYSSKLLLEEHQKIHKVASNALYTCPICEAGCTSSYGLKLHTRIHTGDLPFQCKICEKRFRSTSVLNNHMVTHTGERNHECDICGLKFALHGTLSRHWKRHQLQDTNYTKKCPLCPNLRLKKVYALKDHMEKSHLGTPEELAVLEKYKNIDDRPKKKVQNKNKDTENSESSPKKSNSEKPPRKAKKIKEKITSSIKAEEPINSSHIPKIQIKQEVITDDVDYDDNDVSQKPNILGSKDKSVKRISKPSFKKKSSPVKKS